MAYGVFVMGSKYFAGSLVTGQNCFTGGLFFLHGKYSLKFLSSVNVIKVREHFSEVSIFSVLLALVASSEL